MIRKATTLVLGAGASFTYGFPLGRELTNTICEDLDEITSAYGHLTSVNASSTFEMLRSVGFDNEAIASFRDTLRLSGQPSVDAFLEHRREFVAVGKAAIAQKLIALEDSAVLFKDGWYKHLLDRMNSSFEDFGNNKLSIITFNYDRSIEHFLFTALINRFGKSVEDTARQLAKIPIVHVHGQLGLLEWQTPTENLSSYLSYDSQVDVETIKKGADGIKIISEDALEKRTDFAVARTLMRDAERVYFLGFGYHAENMRRLKVPLSDKNKTMAGTCYGFTRGEKDVLMNSTYQGISLGDEGHDIYKFLRNERSFILD